MTVDLEARLAGLQTGFSKVEQLAAQASRKIGSVGTGFKIGAGFDIFSFLRDKAEQLIRKVPETIKQMDDLDERAQNLGVAAKDLSSLDITAAFSGVDSVDKAFDHFNKTLSDAKAGGAQASAVLRALGVDVKGLSSGTLTSLDAFRQAADTIKTYRDGLEKSALVQEAFGSKQTKLIAFLNQGGAALTQFSGATETSIESAKKFQQELDKMSARSQRFWLNFSGGIAQFLNEAIDAPGGRGDPEGFIKGIAAALRQAEAELEKAKSKTRGPTLLELLIGGSPEEEIAKAQRTVDALTRILANQGTERMLSGRRAILAAENPPPPAPTLPTAEAQSFLKALQQQVALQEKGEFGAKRMQAAELGVAVAAEKNIKILERRKNLLEVTAAFTEDAARAERDRNDFLSRRDDLTMQLRQIELEASLIGKSRDEAEKRTAAFQIYQQVSAATAGKEEGDANRLIALYESLGAAIQAAIDKRQAAANRNTITLIGRDFDEQVKDVKLSTDLIGRTRTEVELLSTAREVDRRQAADTFQLEGKALADMNAAYEGFRAKILGVVSAQEQVRKNLEQLVIVADGMGEAFSKSFDSAVIDGKSLSDAIDDLAKDIQRVLIHELVSKPIADAISDAIKKAFRESAKEGNFDFLSFLKGLFSGGGGPSAADYSQLGVGLTGFASGGYMKPNTWGWVGEHGPELAYSGRGGASIYPAGTGAGSGAGMTVVVNVDARTDAAEVRRNAEQGVRVAVARMRDMQRRNA